VKIYLSRCASAIKETNQYIHYAKKTFISGTLKLTSGTARTRSNSLQTRGEQFVEERTERLGSVDGLLLEGEEFGEFPGRTDERPAQFAVMDFLGGAHQGVEVEGQVFVGGVGDDADGGARDVAFAAEFPDGFGFHFDGVQAGAAPEAEFFVHGDSHAAGAEEVHRCGAGLLDFGVEIRAGFRLEDHFGGFQFRIEAAGIPACEDEPRFNFFQRREQIAFGVVAAHPGDEAPYAGSAREELHFFLHGEGDKNRFLGICSSFCHLSVGQCPSGERDVNNFRSAVQRGRIGNEMCYFLRLMRRIASRPQQFTASLARKVLPIATACLLGSVVVSHSGEAPRQGEIIYTNVIDRSGPWSIHVVRWPRKSNYDLRSVHATGRAIGLAELSEQIRLMQTNQGQPLAGINGDFYQRDGAHAGDPRGLQITDGELVSGPTGPCFWIDAAGEAHTDTVKSQFSVTWPDGNVSPIDVNGNRDPEEIQLYTPMIGPRTRTERGRDITLEPEGKGEWLPLRPGVQMKAKVKSVRDGSNTPVEPGTMVLSLGPIVARELPRVAPGAVLTISTMTSPSLRGAKTAIGGGPVLLHDGKPQRSTTSFFSWRNNYQASSETRRHPRSAIAWNKDYFFLVEVDGRQSRSDGMSVGELSEFLIRLGCTEAMNLDGGGSATLWYNGRVRNRPCEGGERDVANSLVVVKTDALQTRTEAKASQ
jgi:hypothetical protein